VPEDALQKKEGVKKRSGKEGDRTSIVDMASYGSGRLTRPPGGNSNRREILVIGGERVGRIKEGISSFPKPRDRKTQCAPSLGEYEGK